MATDDPYASSPERVLAALVEHPGSTVKQLAKHALVGESSASKALAALETAGRAVRKNPPAGGSAGRGRQPATWEAVVAGPPPSRTTDLLTVAEVAAMCRVSKMTIYRLIQAGEIAAIRVGNSFRIPAEAARDLLATSA